MNIEDRLRDAIVSIEDLLSQNSEMYRRSDTERLKGEIKGLRLALSYLKEEQRTFPAPCNCGDENIGILRSEIGTWHIREGGDSSLVAETWATDCGKTVKVKEFASWPIPRPGKICAECDWGRYLP